eukprot:NODE_5980_length_618_cov_51.864675_g5577_i0.p1 GENE.NODE_5980_length_618_cov_51.864675_g5577_i0~~NODE_5980_length_618_cov_51.864675_g5577_i0.p1  ORF type:complete len:166 (+),score=22.79 NODE_5980_length_618_cov_51.864675_g5577_i0:87-584(+)
MSEEIPSKKQKVCAEAETTVGGTRVVKYSDDVTEVQFVCSIAQPLSPQGEKLTKKILHLVNKAALAKKTVMGLKRILKDINKGKKGLLVLAANVAPVDFIAHVPAVCEKHGVPYIWVPSRTELGLATMRRSAVVAAFVPQELPDDLAATYQKITSIVQEMHAQSL